jgi:hypothetical protein
LHPCASPCALARRAQTPREAVRNRKGDRDVCCRPSKGCWGKGVWGGTTLTTRRVFPNSKWMIVVVVALALVALAFVIPASQAPNAEGYYSVESKDYQGAMQATAASSSSGVSESGAPQMSEQEALDAYGKLPLSFIPNEGQSDKAVRYYAQGAGYGFFFTHKGATLSFADGERRGGHALALDFLGADSDATLTARQRLAGEVNYLIDQGRGIAVDGMGRAYVTGFAQSTDYPTTQGAFDTSFSGGFTDGFVTKLPTS